MCLYTRSGVAVNGPGVIRAKGSYHVSYLLIRAAHSPFPVIKPGTKNKLIYIEYPDIICNTRVQRPWQRPEVPSSIDMTYRRYRL